MKTNKKEPAPSTTDAKVLLVAGVGAAVCKHIWDKQTGIWREGKPWVGIKGAWTRTCINCGAKEYFSKGMFNGWFSCK